MVLISALTTSSTYSGIYDSPATPTVKVFHTASIAAALCGLAGAWVMVRLKASRVLLAAPARPSLTVLTQPLAAISVATYVALLGVVVSIMIGAKSVGWPGLGLLMTALATVAAATTFGMACGAWLPAWLALAIGLGLAAPFIVIGFTPALNPGWLRYLFTFAGSCCSGQGDPAPSVVRAILVMAVGTSVACVVAILASPAFQTLRSHRREVRLLALAGMAFVGATLVSTHFARQVDELGGHAPMVARSAQRECVGSTPRICMWPEHLGAPTVFDTDLTAIRKIQADHGTTQTSLVVDFGVDGGEAVVKDTPAAQVLLLNLNPVMPLARRVDMEASVLGGEPRCSSSGAPDGFTQSNWSDYMMISQRWWSDRLAKAHQLRPSGEPPVDETAYAALMPMPPAQQGRWVEGVRDAIVSCTVPTVAPLS